MPPKRTRGRPSGKRAHPTSDESEERSAEESESSPVVERKTKSKGPTAEEKERMAYNLVRLALFNEASRMPLKRETITKQVLGSYSRMFSTVLDHANEILNKVFAMKLIQLPRRGALEREERNKAVAATQASGELSATQTETATQNTTRKPPTTGTNLYILISTIDIGDNRNKFDIAVPFDENGNENGDGDSDEDDSENDGAPTGKDGAEYREWMKEEGSIVDFKHGEQRALLGILHYILSIILLNERSITETELYSRLRAVGLNNDTYLPLNLSAARRDATTLGVFMAQLQREQYLVRYQPKERGKTQATQVNSRKKQVEAENSDQIDWKWGPRAEIEIGEKAIAEKFILPIQMPRSRSTEDESPEIARARRRREKEASNAILKGISRAAGSTLRNAHPEPEGIELPSASQT